MLHTQWQLLTTNPYLSFLHTVLGRLLRLHQAAIQAVNVERSPLFQGHAVLLEDTVLMWQSKLDLRKPCSAQKQCFFGHKHCVFPPVAALIADITQPFFVLPEGVPNRAKAPWGQGEVDLLPSRES